MHQFTPLDNFDLEQHILENVQPASVWYEMKAHPFSADLNLVGRSYMKQELLVTIKTTLKARDEIYKTEENFLLFRSLIMNYLSVSDLMCFDEREIRLEFAEASG